MLGLLVVAAIMAAVTLGAGLLPLYVSHRFIDVGSIASFGSGVILGAAFIIVIPEGYEQSGETNTRWASCAILLGYVLMLGIDAVSVRPRGKPRDEEFELDGMRDARSGMRMASHTVPSSPRAGSPSPSRGGVDVAAQPASAGRLAQIRSWFAGMSTTTVGLTIHAAADGIALGASAASADPALAVLVFVSILFHKAPAAFSLGSILTVEPGYTPFAVKRDVVLFSLAGPVTAVALGGLLTLLSVSSGSQLIPGLCLAFSGGTFVFVAAHVTSEQCQSQTSRVRGLAIMFAGMLLPFAASFLPD